MKTVNLTQKICSYDLIIGKYFAKVNYSNFRMMQITKIVGWQVLYDRLFSKHEFCITHVKLNFKRLYFQKLTLMYCSQHFKLTRSYVRMHCMVLIRVRIQTSPWLDMVTWLSSCLLPLGSALRIIRYSSWCLVSVVLRCQTLYIQAFQYQLMTISAMVQLQCCHCLSRMHPIFIRL